MIRNRFLVLGVTAFLCGALLLAGVGGVGASHSSENYDEEVVEGQTYWGGQVLAFDDANFNGETWDNSSELTIRYGENGTVAKEFTPDSDGHYLFESEWSFEQYGAGTYYLEGENGTYEFELVEQTLAAEFNDSSVQHNETVTVEVESNRNGYDMVIESSDFTAEELAAIFAEASVETVDGEDKAVVSNVDSTDELTAEFSEDDGAGTYEFTFSSMDTNAESSAEVTVNQNGNPAGQFLDAQNQVSVGNTVEFVVELENTSEGTVEFGGEAKSYSHSVNVTDTNGDGEVTVVFDASAAGTPKETFYGVEDSNDVVTEGNNETDTPGPLAKGSYNRTLLVNGEQYDSGVTAVTSRTTAGLSTEALPYDWNSSENTTFEASNELTTVAEEDHVVVQLDTTGLNGYMENEDVSASDLNEGSSFANNYGFYVTIVEENPEPNQKAEEIRPGEAEYFTYSNNQVVLVFDTDDVNADANETYKATANFTESYPYNSDSETYSAFFTMEERTISVPSEYTPEPGAEHDMEVQVTNEEETQFEIDTNLADGTEVVVQLLREGEDPFFERHTVPVEDGQLVVTPLDMNESETGKSVELSVTTVDETIELKVVEEPTGEASVTVSDSEQETDAGENYVAPFTVTNVGNATMDVDVAYTFGGDVVVRETVTLDPDEEYRVSRTVNEAGEYEQGVVVNNETYMLPNVTVHGETTTEFDVEGPVSPGEPFNVTVMPENVNRNMTVDVSFNGETKEVLFTETGTQNKTVTFTAPDEEGEYNVTVEDDAQAKQSNTLSVEQTETPTPTPGQDYNDTNTAIALLIIFAIVVGAGVLAVFASRRDNNQTQRRRRR